MRKLILLVIVMVVCVSNTLGISDSTESVLKTKAKDVIENVLKHKNIETNLLEVSLSRNGLYTVRYRHKLDCTVYPFRTYIIVFDTDLIYIRILFIPNVTYFTDYNDNLNYL
jgi:hypothetical protein